MSYQQLFPFNNNLVRRFLNWRQGDEEETWRNKAFEALAKKLKRPPNEQYTTLMMVLNQKSEDTPCVTLSRSQDGRLQVSHRKMLPHVMYCRIFRWPDLQSQHELRSVSSCHYPYQRREHNKICVNPYHYARVDHSLYPPVVTPRSTEFADASPPPQSPMSPGSNCSQNPQSSPTYFGNNNASSLPLTPQPAHYQAFQTSLPYKQENPSSPFTYFRNQQQQQQQPPQQPIQQNFYAASQSPESNWSYGTANGVGSNGDGMLQLAESPRAIISQYESHSPPPGYSSRDQQLGHPVTSMSLMPMDTIDETQQTNATDDGHEHWCRITYAELNQKVGEPFKSSFPKVIVDGFTNPSVHNRRFSLGVLSNINRNSTISMTRQAIGKGVCIENNGAQIHVENLSESSIFFHSKNCNVENQLNQHAVVKIERQGRQKIFDQKVFENLVQEALRSQDGKTYERLFSLTEHCIIKMSFVKGWGSIYQRQDVTSTPCWIEIHLLKPYELIDQYLIQVGRPSTQMTSTS